MGGVKEGEPPRGSLKVLIKDMEEGFFLRNVSTGQEQGQPPQVLERATAPTALELL